MQENNSPARGQTDSLDTHTHTHTEKERERERDRRMTRPVSRNGLRTMAASAQSAVPSLIPRSSPAVNEVRRPGTILSVVTHG